METTEIKCDKCNAVIGYQADENQDWIADDEENTTEATDYVKTAEGLFCCDCGPCE